MKASTSPLTKLFLAPLPLIYLVLADAVLILHAAFVAFVVIGLLLIWVGWFCRWRFVRNLWFRVAHVLAIGVVAAESLTGFVCPLTTWENQFRLLAGGQQRYEGSFIQHWLQPIIFFDADQRIFTVAYVVFFLLVALTFWLVPPRWSQATTPPEDQPGDAGRRNQTGNS